MPFSFLEIVELANGDIVLKRSDKAGEHEEPLINIRFSEQSKAYMGEAGIDIAKIMIHAGIQAAAEMAEAEDEASREEVSNTGEFGSDKGEDWSAELDDAPKVLH